MEQLFLARQPIFSRDGYVWGYDIHSRESADTECHLSNTLTEESPASIPSLLLSPECNNTPVHCVMHADQDMLSNPSGASVESDKVILAIDTALITSEGIEENLSSLRSQGAKLSLNIQSQQAVLDQDLGNYQLVAFPFELLGAAMHWSWLEKRDCSRTKLLINKIESHAELEFAKAAGADLFQGNYFKCPTNTFKDQLPSIMVNRFKLLQLLDASADKAQELIRAIEADVSITLRLFTFINSPHFALTRKIESVRQCVQLLGWAQLKTWIRMLVVVEMCPTDKSRELAYSSALRGRFLELLAMYANRFDLANHLFLLGLFSLLEAMLDRPFQQILKDFKLPDAVENALLGRGGMLQPWLEFADVLDDANWMSVDAAAMHLGLDLRCVSRAKLDALTWTNQFWNLAR